MLNCKKKSKRLLLIFLLCVIMNSYKIEIHMNLIHSIATNSKFYKANDYKGRVYFIMHEIKVTPKEQANSESLRQRRLLWDATLESVYLYVNHPRSKYRSFGCY